MKDLNKLREQEMKRFLNETIEVPSIYLGYRIGAYREGWDACEKAMGDKKPFKDIDIALDEKQNM